MNSDTIIPDTPQKKMELLHFAPLHEAQIRAATKFISNGGRGIAWHMVGEGKTRIALTVFATLQFLREWDAPCICVVVCRKKSFHTWRAEIEDCGLGYFVHEWAPDKEGFYDDQVPTIWLVSSEQVSKISTNIFIRQIIVDELYMYKNPKAIRSMAVQKLASRYPTVGLSGSIMTAGNLEDVWGQAAAIGVQNTLCRTFTDFRTEYLISFNTGGFPIRSPRRGANKKIMDLLEPYIDVHFPEKRDRKIHHSIVKVPATEQQKDYWRQLKDTWEIDDVEFNNAAAISIKSQQISNGFVKLKERVGWNPDNTPIFRDVIKRIPSNKPSALVCLVEEIVSVGEKCVVWCAFKEDIEILAEELATAEIATLQMTGEHALDVARWNTGAYPCVLATQASGSSINDFAQIPYGIYYSQNYKWMDMQQSQGRHDRKSSKQTDNYFYFIHTQESLDKQIYDTVRVSKGLEQAIIDKGHLATWLKNL